MARSADRGTQATTFVAEPASTSAARRFAADLVERWGLAHLSADVALCVSELAANALLHAREPFTVTMRVAGEGVRVDVIDPRPDQLPVVVPLVGTVVDLTERSTTGRGMQIVATLADRWGVSTTNGAKAVWVELSGRANDGASAPTIVIGHDDATPHGELLCFLDLPVRAAVASGIQTDESMREIQLAELSHPTVDTPAARILELFDASAPVRLTGRYAALRAAADGHQRFDLEVVVTDESLAAVGALSEQLATVAGTAPDADLSGFRAWLAEETLRQRAGQPPTRCPLPS